MHKPCCGNDAANRRIPYNIILIKQEFYHDIDDDTRQLQLVRNLIEIPVSTDERYRYIIDRYIDRAINHIVARLIAYIATDKPHRIVNNHTSPWEEHSIFLAMPAGWPPENLDHLSDVIHTYVVRMVEAEIFTLTIGANDPIVQQYRIDAQEAENEAVGIVNKRLGPISVPFTPFG